MQRPVELATDQDENESPQSSSLFRQHVIDPEVCVRCCSCLAACPSSAIQERGGTLAIDPDRCDNSGICIVECVSGAIENWLTVPKDQPYELEEQFGWDRLPGSAVI